MALEVESAGAFSVVLEGIPGGQLPPRSRGSLRIPTIGIGAGPDCDGQIMVLHDLLGLNDRHVPKFAKQYVRLIDAAKEGIEGYAKDVTSGRFPAKEHCY